MVMIVKLIGVIMLILGAIISFKPETIKKVMAFFEKDKRIYYAGFIRILLGVIFLLAATQCRLTALIALLGLIFLFSGVFIFYLGLDKVKAVIKKWSDKPLSFFRLLAILIIVIGIVIIYAA
ncbi:MAG: hypothetical protein ABH836_07700 [Candidatus Omnitrophota bacterium]